MELSIARPAWKKPAAEPQKYKWKSSSAGSPRPANAQDSFRRFPEVGPVEHLPHERILRKCFNISFQCGTRLRIVLHFNKAQHQFLLKHSIERVQLDGLFE